MTADLTGKIIALLCAFTWGIAVIFFTRAGTKLKPLALNLYKTAVTAALLFLLMLAAGISLVPANLSPLDWGITALSGFIGITVADSLFFKCLNLIGAGLTAIVDCMYSPMVIGLSWLLLENEITLRQGAGACLIISAVVIITLQKGDRPVPMKVFVLGIASGAGAMFLMALSIIMMKPVLLKASFIWVTEVRLITALIFLFFTVLLRSERSGIFRSMLWKSNWRYAFPGAVIGNFLSMTLWVAAFKYTDVSSAAILNQTSTIFIVILAALILKEPFSLRRIAGTILAFGGSMLVII